MKHILLWTGAALVLTGWILIVISSLMSDNKPPEKPPDKLFGSEENWIRKL